MHRVLVIHSLDDARAELRKIGVSGQGVEVMAPKALGFAVKLCDVRVGAANILKQEMLGIGGDAAVARGVVEGRVAVSDVILLGNPAKLGKLIRKLEHQTIFGLPGIADWLRTVTDDRRKRILNCRGRKLDLCRPVLMGVLNVTPDSFSDGGHWLDPDKAIEHGRRMVSEGAALLDIGGESTRPGATVVSADEEIARVTPVIRALAQSVDAPLCIDTRKAAVASAALEAGAHIVNDISALRHDPDMLPLLREQADVPVILMHMQGEPGNMQLHPHYDDTVHEVLGFFARRIEACVEGGISRERLLLDPGIGFGKRHEDNLILLKKLRELRTFGLPVALGASRKSFLGRIDGSDTGDRLPGTLAVTALAAQGAADILRVHDVSANQQSLQTALAILEVR
ncbi:MAG: dihydropteroate synthase [Candidatus Cloacimonetes bacterium]|nr:dihydropteroate synthase [Candidatus Cloacimonadota bacterium]